MYRIYTLYSSLELIYTPYSVLCRSENLLTIFLASAQYKLSAEFK